VRGKWPGDRAAIVHEYFIQDGGAERCAIEFTRLLPEASVHTTFFDNETFAARLPATRVRTWILQRFVGPTLRFRALLPLYATYFSLLRIRHASLVLSSSIAFTKAVRVEPGTVHVAYVYTPMRYAWDLDTYLAGSSYSLPTRVAARTIRPALQRWDRWTARRPDVVVAISETVRERIRQHWDRESEVIYPPVDVSEIQPTGEDEGFYLVAARLLAYRRVDLAVSACTRLGRPLVVVGDGPERARLEAMAGPSVRFLGRARREQLIRYFQTCRAYLVPGVEDFGIAPVEAMAAGKPVIALGTGGVAETVLDGSTGVLVSDPTVDAFVGAIERSEQMTWNPLVIRSRAEVFDRSVFIERWRELIERLGMGRHLSPRIITLGMDDAAETP
jgi:glycosyltransferase involved in cell wall biosynthesis